jgi:peptidoglycan/LPS O-acetylase OafA/YrhL
MKITLPENLYYFNLLEILFGVCVILFASLQQKYKFKIALQTRSQKRMGLIVCLLIFFVVLAVQLHLGLPQNEKFMNYVYGATIFIVFLEGLQFFLHKNKSDESKSTLRNSGLVVLGLVFIYIGIKTWS